MHNIIKPEKHKHTLEIVVTTTEDGINYIRFNELDDTKKIFSTFRAMYFTLENDSVDYSLSLINKHDGVRLCRCSKSNHVRMYAYNKALLPINILATIPQ